VQQEQAEALQSHRVIIVTGTFLDALTRGRQQELAMRCNADFVGLWLKAPMNTLFARVGTRMQGRSASDADRKVLKKQLKLPTRTPHGAIEWRLLNANQPLPHLVEDAKEAVSDAARKFGGHRPLKIKPPKYFT
jgi:predicted kinase